MSSTRGNPSRLLREQESFLRNKCHLLEATHLFYSGNKNIESEEHIYNGNKNKKHNKKPRQSKQS
jgi:hypothetical protein